MTRKCLMIVALVLLALVAPSVSAQETTGELTAYAPAEAKQLIALSPDGAMVAGTQRDTNAFCTFAVPSGETIACVALDREERTIGLQRSEVRWSPDSQMIVFAEPALQTGRNGDLWLFGAKTGQLTNLTGEGDVGTFKILDREGQTADVYLDIAPAWSPDGSKIAFSRTTVPFDSDGWISDLMLLDLLSGEVTKLATVDPERPGALYGILNWSPDGSIIYGSVWDPVGASTRSGVWAFDVASGAGAQLAGKSNVPEFENDVALLNVSPAGDWLGLYDPNKVRTGIKTEQGGASGFALLSLADASVSTVQPPADLIELSYVMTAPGFTPDGSTIIYGVFDDTGNTGYVIARTIATGEESVLATLAGESPMTVLPGIPTQISANGTVLIQTQPESGYLLTLPANLLTPPAVSSASEVIVTQPVAAGGAYAVRQADTAMRAAPSFEADVLLSLPKDALVESLGDPVDSGADRWAPVRDPESGMIGYVNMSYLTSTTAEIEGLARSESAGTPYAIKWADAELRAAPSFDAPVVLVLQRDDRVVSLGDPVEQGGEQWAPVRDPNSAVIGYARLFDLKPA